MNAGNTNGQDQDAGATIGVGGATSGQAGATPSHETQRETGGSGGDQLTASHGDAVPEGAGPDDAAGAGADAGKNAGAGKHAAAAPNGAPSVPRNPAEPDDSSMHSNARGALDTRASQAGGTGTGLGSRESGANQSPADLAPPADGPA